MGYGDGENSNSNWNLLSIHFVFGVECFIILSPFNLSNIRGTSQGLANCPPLLLSIKFYWRTAMSIPLRIVCVCSVPPQPEMGSCDRDFVACKAETINHLARYRSSLLTAGLGEVLCALHRCADWVPCSAWFWSSACTIQGRAPRLQSKRLCEVLSCWWGWGMGQSRQSRVYFDFGSRGTCIYPLGTPESQVGFSEAPTC